MQKKRVPNNLDEYINWLEDYLIRNQDPEVFQQIAWFLDENEIKKNTNSTYMKMYKWQYLCSELCKSYLDRDRAISEMKILSKINLTNSEIDKATSEALKWQNKYWNKTVNNNQNSDKKIERKNTLVDIIRDALIRK